MQTIVNPLISLYIKNCQDLTFNPFDGLPELIHINILLEDTNLTHELEAQCGINPDELFVWGDTETLALVDREVFVNPLQSYLLVEFCTARKIDIFGLIKSGYAHDIC